MGRTTHAIRPVVWRAVRDSNPWPLAPEATPGAVQPFAADRMGSQTLDSVDGAGVQPSPPAPSARRELATPVLRAPGASLRVVEGGMGALLTVRAAAGLLGVSAATVYKLCESGALPCTRILNAIRIKREDLAALLSAR